MRIFISSCLVLFSLSLSAQDFTSEQLLNNAKEGFLLFRLTTQNKKIEALTKDGKDEEAIALQSKIEAEHLAWMKAFKTEYNYGKVYFFYDLNARDIVSGDLTSVFDFDFENVEGLGSNFIVAGPDETETFSLSGILVLAPDMSEVPKGMPRFISAYGFAHLSKKSNFQMVKELNSALSKY
jgi:hypothetical protein